MSISINQTPADVSLAQSPIVFSVLESDANTLASSSMQYVAELTYWTGSILISGSADYTLTKYPNNDDYGIFDLSKIINSTLTEKLQQNESNGVYFKVKFYPQFVISGSTQFSTGSSTTSTIYGALDGYGLFGEAISSSLEEKSSYFPLMTDGPVTQSTFLGDYGRIGVFKNGINSGLFATKVAYSGSSGEKSDITLTSAGATSQWIESVPIGSAEADFPLVSENDWFTIQAKDSSGLIGEPIRFDYKCEQKYPNVRIKWKNRFGQFDNFNFDMVSRESFSTTKRTYQPQVGSWDSSTLSYNQYDSSIENYVADSSQTLQVNTDWVSEDYNDIFKQLLLSDEIYWMYSGDNVKPLAIKTSNIQFKTGVVDKLIRYTFDFDLGQNYKLIL